jgi:hypothetical protein
MALALTAGAAVNADDKSDKPKADPAATKLLASARAARAEWKDFPGFSADVEINLDGRIVKGRAVVSAKGEVKLDLNFQDKGDDVWARRTLSSVAGHRLDSGPAAPTPCTFDDDVTDHPLGRAVRVLDDEFHSSYRIRDDQILVVNRRMGDGRFTITVMENVQNEEKKYLPACFVVDSWDAKDALTSSEAHHQTWKRLEGFDLPLTITVVNSASAKQEAKSIKLSNHKLTAKAGE